jgi:hypothetical protein
MENIEKALKIAEDLKLLIIYFKSRNCKEIIVYKEEDTLYFTVVVEIWSGAGSRSREDILSRVRDIIKNAPKTDFELTSNCNTISIEFV